MNGEERRALRAIEEALAAEDPALAGMLRGRSRATTARRLRRTMWVLIGLAALLLLLGIVAADGGLQTTAILMLPAVPVATAWGIRRFGDR